MNTYLIAYIAPNGRVSKRYIEAESQVKARDKFYEISPSCEIIAITLWEN